MSGLIPIVAAGPRLLEAGDDVRPAGGQPLRAAPSMLTVGPAFAAAQATNARPSLSVTIDAGMAGAVRATIDDGGSGLLLWTISAVAPAGHAMFFLISNVQVPRATSAILPAMLPGRERRAGLAGAAVDCHRVRRRTRR